MKVCQVLLVGEDDGLVLRDDLAPEALPARGQLSQLLQFTHSAMETHMCITPENPFTFEGDTKSPTNENRDKVFMGVS